MENARREARVEGTKALDELRAATRRDVSKLAERSEQIESALENAQKERSRLAQETAELRIALDTERSEASARYGDLERRRRREVEAARAELPEGYRGRVRRSGPEEAARRTEDGEKPGDGAAGGGVGRGEERLSRGSGGTF